MPGTNLSTARLMALTGASSATVGYMAGGDTGSYVSDFQKITFSTETVASMPANRSHNGAYAAATGNSDAAYIAGGYGPPIISRCDKLTYSLKHVKEFLEQI